jgi:hypothetical protein
MRGVLALYALDKESFSKDQLEILLAIEPKLATAVESALLIQEANAMADSLAALANPSAARRPGSVYEDQSPVFP